MTASATSDDEPGPPSGSGLAKVSLCAACVGWITFPFGLLLVAWAFFVAVTIIVTSLRDGRRVARTAYATLAFSILPAALFHGSP